MLVPKGARLQGEVKRPCTSMSCLRTTVTTDRVYVTLDQASICDDSDEARLIDRISVRAYSQMNKPHDSFWCTRPYHFSV